jgi:hypothetical protein
MSVLEIFVLAQLAPPLHQGLTFANLLFHSCRSVAEDASRLCLCHLLFCFAAHEPETPDLIFCSKTELLALQHLSLTLFARLIWFSHSAPVSFAARVGLRAQGRRSILFLWPVLCDLDFCMDCCKKKSILLLSHRIKRIEDSWFKLFFYGDFSNALISCSVKCL